MIEYKSYDYTRTIPVDDYILRFGMSGVSWPIAGSAVGMETVGVVRLLMKKQWHGIMVVYSGIVAKNAN